MSIINSDGSDRLRHTWIPIQGAVCSDREHTLASVAAQDATGTLPTIGVALGIIRIECANEYITHRCDENQQHCQEMPQFVSVPGPLPTTMQPPSYRITAKDISKNSRKLTEKLRSSIPKGQVPPTMQDQMHASSAASIEMEPSPLQTYEHDQLQTASRSTSDSLETAPRINEVRVIRPESRESSEQITAPTQIRTPPTSEVHVNASVHVPLDDLAATTPSIEATVLQDGVPIATGSFQPNLRHLSHSHVNVSAPVSESGVSLGISTSLNRPVHDMRVTAAVPGASVSASLRHPVSDIQTYATVVPGIGISGNLNLRHPRHYCSSMRVVLGLPIQGLNVSFPARKIMKPIEKGVKKIFGGGGGGDGSAGGAPWFPHEVCSTPQPDLCYFGNRPWADLTFQNLSNHYGVSLGTYQQLIVDRDACINALSTASVAFRGAAALEAEVRQCLTQSYAEKVALRNRIVQFLNESHATFDPLHGFITNLNDLFYSRADALQTQMIDKMQFLSTVLQSFNFGNCSSNVREFYSNHLQYFHNLLPQIHQAIEHANTSLVAMELKSNQSKLNALYNFLDHVAKIPQIGGVFDFTTGERHGFEALGAATLQNNGNSILCTSNATDADWNPGVIKTITLIPGKKHILQVTGSAIPGPSADVGTAYLFVRHSHNGPQENIVWANLPTAMALPNASGTVEIEFTAPYQFSRNPTGRRSWCGGRLEPLSTCQIGILFNGLQTNGRSFAIERLAVALADSEETEFAGHLIAACAQSPIGGVYDFTTGSRYNFLPHGSTSCQGQNGLRCTSNGEGHGILKSMRFVRGRRYMIQATGSSDIDAYLRLSARDSLVVTPIRLPRERGTIQCEFIAPDRDIWVQFASMGGSNTNGRSFTIEQLTVTEVDAE